MRVYGKTAALLVVRSTYFICTAEPSSYDKPEIFLGQTVCYNQEFVISEMWYVVWADQRVKCANIHAIAHFPLLLHTS